MRMTKFGIIAAGIVLCLMTSSGFAADVANLGVVDMKRIAENSSAGKAAKTKLKSRFEELKAQLTKKGSEIERLKKQFEREAMVMSEEKRQERERDLRIKMDDLRILKKNSEKEMQTQNLQIMEAIRTDVVALIEEIGKKEGYLIVLERTPFIYYAPQSIDLTDQLIQQYNALFAKGSTEAAKILK